MSRRKIFVLIATVSAIYAAALAAAYIHYGAWINAHQQWQEPVVVIGFIPVVIVLIPVVWLWDRKESKKSQDRG